MVNNGQKSNIFSISLKVNLNIFTQNFSGILDNFNVQIETQCDYKNMKALVREQVKQRAPKLSLKECRTVG